MRNCTLKVFDIWLELLCYLIVKSFFGGVEAILTVPEAVRLEMNLAGLQKGWPVPEGAE